MHAKGRCKFRVAARSLLCYWAVRELGLTMTDVARRLKISVATVSIAVKKGMKVVLDEGLVLGDLLNKNIKDVPISLVCFCWARWASAPKDKLAKVVAWGVECTIYI